MVDGWTVDGPVMDGPAVDGSALGALALSPPIIAVLLLLLDFPMAPNSGGSNTSEG